MNIITIDFETYYDKQFSLSKLTIVEYIKSPQFEVIGVAVKVNSQPVSSCFGHKLKIKAFLDSYDWEDSIVVAHNAYFDMAILEWEFGYKPKQYFCTMLAARALVRPYTPRGSVSLRTVAEFFKLGHKGTEVQNVLGMHLEDFTPQGLYDYEKYCQHDVNLTYAIWQLLAPELPEDEHLKIHLTVRKFTRPQLKIDGVVCRDRLVEHINEKKQLLHACGVVDAAQLRSNNKFADLLMSLGVSPPTKISPTTGKEIYAFAKTDQGMKDLVEHSTPIVSALAEARLGHKTSIEQSRIERFITLADFPGEWLPVSLLYYGAHTGRHSGTHKINLQNLTRGSALRKAVVAPSGYKIITGDLSQIEARIVACLAGQQDLVTAFENDEDVYSKFASVLYGYPVDKLSFPDERFVGKTCILGLGYSMGWSKFYDTMKVNPNVNMTEREAQRTVQVYRNTYPMIPKLWKTADLAIAAMATGKQMAIGPVYTIRNAIILPNGMKINYPGLTKDLEDNWIYESPKGIKKIYGGALVENIVQALAQIVLSYAEIRLAKRKLFAANQVHDELIYVVRDGVVDNVSAALEVALTAPVPWMPSLPVACEIACGQTYYDAK